MNIFTIGFTQKSANKFFELIKNNGIDILLDIRLNNKSQLAGFTKGDDLKYFLSEICKCEYRHCLKYAPNKEILDDYKKKRIGWEEYVLRYTDLMTVRGDYLRFENEFSNYSNICLLCSEPKPDNCHRRLLAGIIANSASSKTTIKHI